MSSSSINNRKSFATFLILFPTSFFLGLLFAQLPYDHAILWSPAPTSSSAETLSRYTTHLEHLHSSPPIVPRILHIIISIGLLGFFIRLYRPSESNTLFDGASLFLYMCGVTVYIVNVVGGFRALDLSSVAVDTDGKQWKQDRVDDLRVMAASNTILALVLLGVLGLQVGQWYADRKDLEERKGLAEARRHNHNNGAGVSSNGGMGGQQGGKKKV